jgi:hypothetical protein
VSHGSRFGGVVYGEAPTPGAPRTWNRSVWWALNRAARVGEGTGRHRWRQVPPFHYEDLLVTAGRPALPYGLSTSNRGRLTHLPHTVLFAWRRGQLVGRMIAWRCGARTAYFRLSRVPGPALCQMCVFQARGRVAE